MVCCVLIGSVKPLCACEPDRIDASAKVEWVHDGDTVSLDEGQKVRMIGINAPELARNDNPGQPYAKKARRIMRAMLAASDNRVQLRYGKQREDRHGRLLAHVYLPDNSNLSAEMLRRGLAVAITIPPNDWNLECYRQAEAGARVRRLGIWALPEFQNLDSNRLRGGEHGYRIVEGVVESIASSRYSTWLNLRGNLGVHIDHDDALHFRALELTALEGKRIAARGWIYDRRGRLRMRLRHPADLSIVR